MSDNTIPGLTPRTVRILLGAGDALAEQVRAKLLHSPRPVFLYYIEQTFDTLHQRLSLGLDPHPGTPAEQLCLHLMISYAQQRAGSLDADLIRLHRVLLPGRRHQTLAEVGRIAWSPRLSYDFVALGDALTPGGMNAFFAPVEPDDLVA
ncbi:hypothetical protein [Nocardia sp. BMG51109]|uniref:hypothetical protein n=1 Tax=Nocardia sp. BMG51109 TaxID=1056816 RepID=UPI000465AE11|nr:hypothetical protein [Nocardia sp. BMG51109]